MKPATFVRQVQDQAPPGLAQEALQKAVGSVLWELGENGELGRWHVTRVIELAGRLEPSVAKPPKLRGATLAPEDKDDRVVEAQPTFGATEIATSDVRCDALAPEVEAAREDLFGSSQPPFKSWRAAERWINQTDDEECRTTAGEAASHEEVRNQALALQRGARGAEVHVRQRRLLYPRKKRGGKVELAAVPARAGGKLNKLARRVEKIAAASGFEPVAVTWWVLTDLRPLLPRMRISERSTGHRTSIAIEVNSRDVGWRELWRAYRHVRRLPSLERRRVKPRSLRIYQLVKERGGVPRMGKTAFWEEIRRQIVRENNGKGPRRWESVRKAYLEASRRITATVHTTGRSGRPAPLTPAPASAENTPEG